MQKINMAIIKEYFLPFYTCKLNKVDLYKYNYKEFPNREIHLSFHAQISRIKLVGLHRLVIFMFFWSLFRLTKSYFDAKLI